MIRRYAPLRSSPGTLIPNAIRRQVILRDAGCLGPRLGMPIPCVGAIELDHVRTGGMGLKSRTSADNLVSLCATHHRLKTLEGRAWRPKLLAYLETLP
jgi:5-methylcytosine-specific restriction endonuclease McrA